MSDCEPFPFFNALVNAGAVAIDLPVCDRCGEPVPYVLQQRDGSMACDDCADYGRKAVAAAQQQQRDAQR